MAKTKIIIALVALAVVALVAVGFASAQLATQTPNSTTEAALKIFWGYIGRCFQFRANQPVDQTTGTPIAQQGIPPQSCNTNAPIPTAQNGYCFNSGCISRFW